MYRFIRSRCIIIRYIILWLFIITLIKVTTIFYYDLQQQSIDSSSLALPFDEKKLLKETTTTTKTAQSLNTSFTINRTTIEYYRQYVQRKNHEQLLLNSHLFSSQTTRYVLLVQVHTRVVYLKKFIEMLKNVERINQTLLIFSHDFIDPEINILVENITFVPVKEIVFF